MRTRNGPHTAAMHVEERSLHRSRLIALLISLAVTLVTGPIMATVALGADPSVVVQTGDTLTRLSKRHGVSIATLVELNDLAHPNRIYAGQRLRIATSAPRSARPVAPSAARVHTVGPGQNLTVIARQFRVTVAAIVGANNIANASRIYVGQRLAIPTPPTAAAAAPAPAKPAATRIHVVKSGQNLTTIARGYGLTVAAIAHANNISNPSRIHAGQRLTILGPPVPAALPPSMATLMSRRDAVRRVIVEEANQYHVPPALALAVAWQESGWQQGVVSHAGAVGVMQLMPATADWVGDAMLGYPVRVHDTRSNVRGGVRLLAHYLGRYDGDRARVLAAYYQGQSAVDRHGIYAVSRPYIASIKVLEDMFGG